MCKKIVLFILVAAVILAAFPLGIDSAEASIINTTMLNGIVCNTDKNEVTVCVYRIMLPLMQK